MRRALDSTTRFSNRVDNYIRYRPGYPAEIIGLLRRDCALTEDSIVADIGSGTGKLTEFFLENGNQVLIITHLIRNTNNINCSMSEVLERFGKNGNRRMRCIATLAVRKFFSSPPLSV